jgi:hypothetical protein
MARLVGAGSGEVLYLQVERDDLVLPSRMAVTGSGGTAVWSQLGPSDPSTEDDPPLVELITVFWDRNRNGTYDGPAEFTATATIAWDEAP